MNTSDKELQEAAEKAANDAGYPQSDKESFETTYWTQHNIYEEGFIAGAKYILSREQGSEGVRELINAYWKFDDNQRPVSSWHDKQDLLELISKLQSPSEDKIQKAIELLTDAKNQIEYLGEKFKETGTGNAMVSKISHFLNSIK